MLIEIHFIQNHAPSNLNRDDTGSPKDCLFGGTLRARISSQCLKRSIRQSVLFRKALDGHLGTRTRRLPQQIKEHLLALGCDESDAELIARKATRLGSEKKEAKANDQAGDGAAEKASADGDSPSTSLETRQLIFLDQAEVPAIASALRGIFEEKGRKAFEALKIKDLADKLDPLLPRSVDIALFGRMTTSKAFQDVESGMQVAHAISTHKVERQFDYFTAVDDLVEASDEKGAGMIGDVEFNSATYYKYFSLDWDTFLEHLGGDTETALAALGAFLQAAALTTPTGKQNSFAAHNPPDAILVEVKQQKLPINYATAFFMAVRGAGGRDVTEVSIAALSQYRSQLRTAYPLATKASLYLTVRGEQIEDATRVTSLGELVSALTNALAGAPAGVAP